MAKPARRRPSSQTFTVSVIYVQGGKRAMVQVTRRAYVAGNADVYRDHLIHEEMYEVPGGWPMPVEWAAEAASLALREAYPGLF